MPSHQQVSIILILMCYEIVMIDEMQQQKDVKM